MRRSHARRLRRLEEKGPVELHVSTTAEPAFIDEMLRLKKAWCETQGKRGIFDHAGVNGFFHTLLKAGEAKGTLRFFRLTCGDKTIAYRAGFLYRDVFHSYLVSYDPAWAAHSPGNLMNIKAISWAIDNGAREFNLMQGENAQKLQFSNGTRLCADWTISASLAGRAQESLYVMYWSLQRSLLNGGTSKAPTE
jgi:CelD/BcsL family acetyltransferase involved in cellulose biosynthesis